ncbi:MAG: hypothetical protein QG565_1766 [Campylobacterota bacterium]|nr:hypothetical protein [Campylobacterota bacterium]MDQ1268204.1 hypothetical protein [Campylobacterota bacterium]MDQ1337186.1 hypothetical protein [Campylobacterota bacterium]
MNKISLSIGVAALLIMCGCSDKPKDQEQNSTTQKTQEQSSAAPQTMYGVPATTAPAATEPTSAEAAGGAISNTPYFGKVLETINSGGYTYAKVDEGGNAYWIAGPQTTLSVGSSVSFIEQMVMKDFTSKSLNRTFDHLVFVTAIVPAGGAEASSAAAQPAAAGADAHANCNHDKELALQPIATDVKVAKNASGYTIEEIYTKKATLKDKSVKVNAKVVKVSKNIMGKDWIHLQDGSGAAGTDDIIATAANSTVQVGDSVTATGTVKTDIDLGYGYNFPVLIEETKFTSL